MKLSDFDYELPQERIATFPSKSRTESRLMVLSPSRTEILPSFLTISDWLKPGDVLVLNETRVIPARLEGRKPSGAKVELLLERVFKGRLNAGWFHTRSSSKLKSGESVLVGGCALRLERKAGRLWALSGEAPLRALFEAHGEVPLPPYMSRRPEDADVSRYQTVFASKEGSVAAPTAGLHFDESLLQSLREKGVTMVKITLHIGAGTFLPVKTQDVEDHPMHSEFFEISQETASVINRALKENRRVIPVGTSALRALESAARLKTPLSALKTKTRLFIRPPFDFRVASGLITNFHQPKSTLLMLVSAFSGRERILEAYRRALQEKMRFLSYGDAMLLLRRE